LDCALWRWPWSLDSDRGINFCSDIFVYLFPSALPILLKCPFICFVSLLSVRGPPVWSRGESSWLQTQMSGFDSRHYQIFWEVVGLERVPLSLSWVQLKGYLKKKVAVPV
jgi:hypothetical protein